MAARARCLWGQFAVAHLPVAPAARLRRPARASIPTRRPVKGRVPVASAPSSRRRPLPAGDDDDGALRANSPRRPPVVAGLVLGDDEPPAPVPCGAVPFGAEPFDAVPFDA